MFFSSTFCTCRKCMSLPTFMAPRSHFIFILPDFVKSARLSSNEVLFESFLLTLSLLMVFWNVLFTDLPSLPACSVKHCSVLCCSLHWHIDWVPFKSPVLPPLFTPIVNLYNAVKDCFTHLGYTICCCMSQTGVCQRRRGEKRRAQSLPRGRWSAIALKDLGVTL